MIGDGLVRAGFIDQQQLEKVLAKQRSGDTRRFGEVAIELGFLTDDEMMRYLESWARGGEGATDAEDRRSPGGDEASGQPPTDN